MRGLPDVAVGPARHVAEHHFFRHPAAHRHDQAVEHLQLALAELVLLGQEHRHAQRRAPRDDRHLVQRVGVCQHDVEERVPGLVVGGVLLFLHAERHRAAFAAPAHLVARFFEFGQSNGPQTAPGGQQRRLVDDVRQLGTGITRRAARDGVHLDAFRDLHALGVDLQDLFAALHVGQRHVHLPVEATWTQ